MALSLTVTNHWSDTKFIHVTGTILASGNYVTGGDSNVTITPNNAIKSASPPVYMQVQGVGNLLYRPVITVSQGGKLKIYVPNSGAEYTAGAYGADVTADAISFYAIFPKFQ